MSLLTNATEQCLQAEPDHTPAGHLPARLRVPAGDAVAIDMPMTADAVVIYLGIVLAGCAVVSIADSFAAPEIASRTRIAHTKAIFTQVGIQVAGLSDVHLHAAN